MVLIEVHMSFHGDFRLRTDVSMILITICLIFEYFITFNGLYFQ